MTAICIAGITGWTGGAIAAGVAAAGDLELRAGVSRSAAGGEVEGAPVYARVGEALEFVENETVREALVGTVEGWLRARS